VPERDINQKGSRRMAVLFNNGWITMIAPPSVMLRAPASAVDSGLVAFVYCAYAEVSHINSPSWIDAVRAALQVRICMAARLFYSYTAGGATP